MSRRAKPPFRADHVGSLLRPREVLQARADREAGRISPKQLRVIEDKAIRQAVKMQEDAGLQAVTDGEMRRKSWHMDFLYRIGGMEKASSKVPVQFHGAGGDITYAAEGLRITAPLNLTETIFGEDFAYLKSVAKAVPKLSHSLAQHDPPPRRQDLREFALQGRGRSLRRRRQGLCR